MARREKLRLSLLFSSFILFGAVTSQADTLTVCAAGCTYTNAQLQQALNEALPGDTILTQSGFTYQGTFVLPDFVPAECPANDNSCRITLRTGVLSNGALLDTKLLPGPDIRTNPSYLPLYSILEATVNQAPSLRAIRPGQTTAYDANMDCAAAPCVAEWWNIENIAFLGEFNGYRPSIVALGNYTVSPGSAPNGDLQNLKSEQPNNITLDRVIVYGDPIRGHFRGINLSGKNLVVKNSYVHHIKSAGESQAIYILNADGPIDIINNYLESGGEIVLTEGAESPGVQIQTITGGASTTGATLSSVVDLEVNQWIHVVDAGVKYSVKIATINGNDVTWTPALLTAPDVPGEVKWNITTRNVTFKYNHFTRPPSWKTTPIIGAPSTITANVSTTGGTLVAGTYYYRVVSRMQIAEDFWVTSPASIERSAVVPVGTTTGKITLTWSSVPNALEYRVYGRSSGGQNIYFTVTAPTVTLADTGAAGTAGVVPTGEGNKWAIKNVFEFKGCDTCLVEGNVMEYSWPSGQIGGIALLKAVNTEGHNPSNVLRNLTFQYNKLRHGTYAWTLYTNTPPVGIPENLVFRHNLAEDIGGPWSDNTTNTYFGAAIGCQTAASSLGLDTQNVTFEHNTQILISQIREPFRFTCVASDGTVAHINNMILNNNVMKRMNLGVRRYTAGAGSPVDEGIVGFEFSTTGASEFKKNIVAGANCSVYGPDNFCPPTTEFEEMFVDYAAGNFRIKPTSLYATASTTGTALGADIDAIELRTNIALSGDNTGTTPPPPTPPSIVTATIPSGLEGAAYTTTFTANGTTPFAWSYTGSLTPGTTLDSVTGTLSAVTLSTPGTFVFTVIVTDANGLTASREYTHVINAYTPPPPDEEPPPLQRPDQINYDNGIHIVADVCPTDPTKKAIRVGDICYDLTEGALKKATSVSPAVVWDSVSGAVTSDINALTDVVITAPADNQVLTYDGVNWVNEASGSTTLDALTDVTITTPASGQVLTYDGAGWINQAFNNVIIGGQTLGGVMNIGTLDDFTVNIISNSLIRARFGDDFGYIDPRQDNNPELEVTALDTSAWNMGMATGNGKKIIHKFMQGTNRSVSVWGDGSNLTDYVWAQGVANDGTDNYELTIGMKQNGQLDVKNFTLISHAEPTCDNTNGPNIRGQIVYVAGGVGVKDTVRVCTKDAANNYGWRTIY